MARTLDIARMQIDLAFAYYANEQAAQTVSERAASIGRECIDQFLANNALTILGLNVNLSRVDRMESLLKCVTVVEEIKYSNDYLPFRGSIGEVLEMDYYDLVASTYWENKGFTKRATSGRAKAQVWMMKRRSHTFSPANGSEDKLNLKRFKDSAGILWRPFFILIKKAMVEYRQSLCKPFSLFAHCN